VVVAQAYLDPPTRTSSGLPSNRAASIEPTPSLRPKRLRLSLICAAVEQFVSLRSIQDACQSLTIKTLLGDAPIDSSPANVVGA